MRISHSQLEECLVNPARWYQTSLIAEGHPYPMGYERALRLSVFHFHKSNAGEARRYLDRLIRKHKLSNAKRVSQIETDLDRYFAWAAKEALRVADTNVNLAFQLGFLELRGKVGRIDITGTGYRAVLFASAPQDWERQLRMPLIQAATASIYMRPAEKFEVGFQQLNGANLVAKIYTSKDVELAEARFRRLGAVLEKLERDRKLRSSARRA